MLEKLRIKNFRSLKDETFDLHSGINVFWGLSNSGKTNAAVRSPNLLTNNRPSGGKFLRNGLKKGHVIVEAKFSEGNKVKIDKDIVINKKGEKVLKSTTYFLNDEKPFEGVGTNVPDRIAEVFNVSELNVQDQLSRPFLITESAGVVAKTLNRITKLEQVDDWVSKLTTRINTTNRDISKLDDEIEIKESQLKVYEDLDETESLVKEVESLEFSINDKENKINKLDSYLEDIETYTKEIERLKPFLLVIEMIDEAEELQSDVEEKEKDLTQLKGYLNVVSSLKEEIGDVNLLDESFELLRDAEGIEKEIDSLSIEKEDLRELLDDINGYKQDVDNKKVAYEKAKKSLIMLLEELGQCPFCLGDIDQKCFERLIKEI